jgi:hypothetical protein
MSDIVGPGNTLGPMIVSVIGHVAVSFSPQATAPAAQGGSGSQVRARVPIDRFESDP